MGCRVDRCPHSYHLLCAKAAKCKFYPSKFVIACDAHAPYFKHEEEPVVHGDNRWVLGMAACSKGVRMMSPTCCALSAFATSFG